MMTPNKRPPYHVDLTRHITACEVNYARLLSLLPGLRDGTETWHYEAGSSRPVKIIIKLRESAPYTSVIDVEQSQDSQPLPRMSLRLCHDADVAEIIAWDRHRQWESNYHYPNKNMYQPDEKQALNRFLGEWLDFCRKQGLVSTDICDSVLVPNQANVSQG